MYIYLIVSIPIFYILTLYTCVVNTTNTQGFFSYLDDAQVAFRFANNVFNLVIDVQ